MGLKLCEPGEWLVGKHDVRTRRSWQKLYPGLDPEMGQTVAASLIAKEVDDAVEAGALLDQVAGAVASFTAEGGYDQISICDDAVQRRPDAAVGVPPRATAVCATPPRPHRCSVTAISNTSPSTAAWAEATAPRCLICALRCRMPTTSPTLKR